MTSSHEFSSKGVIDPFLRAQSDVVQEGEFVLLNFSDKRQIFAEALTNWRGSKAPPLKINKRTYNTDVLVGIAYGTVLELDHKRGLVPLPEGEDLMPDHDELLIDYQDHETTPSTSHSNETDNRHLLDDNRSQGITTDELDQMKSDPAVSGAHIVEKIIQNSSTFASKTTFSKAKYIKRKQMKYQPRCRVVRCTSSNICQAMYAKDPRRIMNLREDSLAQILSFANISAGSKTLVFDTCMGLVTGACAQRMGGYGNIFALFTGQAPYYVDFLGRFNLSFVEHSSVKWIHSGQLFHDDTNPVELLEGEDLELKERNKLKWPCHLQEHTKEYLIPMNDKERLKFLSKRCGRFSRKLTRPTPDEVLKMLNEDKKCDSLILACNYDPTDTLLNLLPYLEASCPFVVFFDYMEPLMQCFQELQRQKLAINLRLSDTWMREYQVLPNRTHPQMTMSQNGGFILSGIKLCPIHGKNELPLDEDEIDEIRAEYGGVRGKKRRKVDINNLAPGGGRMPRGKKQKK